MFISDRVKLVVRSRSCICLSTLALTASLLSCSAKASTSSHAYVGTKSDKPASAALQVPLETAPLSQPSLESVASASAASATATSTAGTSAAGTSAAGTETAVAEKEPESPVRIVSVPVPKDKAVLIVEGKGTIPIIYLHGRCGNPTAFRAWARVGRAFGTIISVLGDKKCKNGTGRTKWTEDAAAIDQRITRAIAAVEASLKVDLDESKRVIVGYSQGSLRAEALTTRFPKNYPLAMLIAGPRAPRDESLRDSSRVLLMTGEYDSREPLIDAAKRFAKRGTDIRYIELPRARHGDYGPEAEPTMQLALEWLLGGDRDKKAP